LDASVSNLTHVILTLPSSAFETLPQADTSHLSHVQRRERRTSVAPRMIAPGTMECS
jgi:hypothetical protein